jgi:hypothetical protein
MVFLIGCVPGEVDTASRALISWEIKGIVPDMLRIGLIALALTISAPALAQGAASEAERQACEPDVYRLCNDYVPDVDRIVACLNANKRALGPACRAVMSRPHRR